MKKTIIVNKKANLRLEFDGDEWKFYDLKWYLEYLEQQKDSGEEIDLDQLEPLVLEHWHVEESPYYLYRFLKEFGDPDRLMRRVAARVPDLKPLIDGFYEQRARLDERMFLMSVTRSGMLDSCTENLWLVLEPDGSYSISASLDTADPLQDPDQRGYERNAYGEIAGGGHGGFRGAPGLYEAIAGIYEDSFSDMTGIDWNRIIKRLEPDLPALASGLKDVLDRFDEKGVPDQMEETDLYDWIGILSSDSCVWAAESRIKQAIHRFPFSGMFYAARGDLRMSLQRIAEAALDYETALQLGFENCHVLAYLGVCLDQLGDLGSALEYLDQAIELEPENGEGYLARSIICRHHGRFEQASLDEAKLRQIEGETSQFVCGFFDGIAEEKGDA